MAIGDTFGGLAADQRARRQQLFVESRAPIQDYFQQQALDQSARARDESMALNIAQMREQRQMRQLALDDQEQRRADEAARYNLEYLTRQQDAGLNREAQRQAAGLQRDYFDLDRDKLLTAKTEKLDALENTGAALAQSFGQVQEDYSKSKTELDRIQSELAKIHQMASSSGGVMKSGAYVLKAPDPSGIYQERLTRLNHALVGLMDEAKPIAQTYAERKRDLDFLMRNELPKNGFVPDLGTKSLIHGRTGKRYSFGAPQLSEGGMIDQGYFAPPNRVANPAPSMVPAGSPYLAAPMAFVMPRQPASALAQMTTRKSPMVPVPAQRVKGQPYELPDGSVKIWIGTGWIDPVQ